MSMKKPLFTSLAPNVEWDDVWKSLSLFFKFQRNAPIFAIGNLEDAIQTYFECKKVFLFESGRSALTAILRSAGIGQGSEVLLQAFTCVAVPNTILWVGARPVYVDCDTENYTMSPQDMESKITSHTRAVIIQHTFGIPADMAALLAIARRHNLLVIEDCAHAIGSTYDGVKVGTFGDASIISFGRDKVFSSVFGGAAIINNSSFISLLEEMYSKLSFPRMFWTQQQLLHPPLTALVKATYRIGIGKALLALFCFTKILHPPVTRDERKSKQPSFVFHKLPPALAVLALRQWKKMERFCAHRKKLTSLYETSQAGLADVKLVFHDPRTDTIFLRYPLQVPDATAALTYARRHAIYLGDWYDTPIAPRDVNLSLLQYRLGSCPNAENLSKNTINLPTSIGITGADAKRIVIVIKSYLDSIRRDTTV